MSFRDNILTLREKHNMTQEQLAMLVGVSRQSVTKWEAGKASPDMDKLLKLCDIFHVSLDELVKGDLSEIEPVATATLPQAEAQQNPQDVIGYDDHYRRYAWMLSLGSAVIPVGIGLGLLICVNTATLNKYPFLLIFPILAAVAICVYCSIIAQGEHKNFKQAHPFVQDFYTEEDKRQANGLFARELGLGMLIIAIGITAAFSADSATAIFPNFMLADDSTLAPGVIVLFMGLGVQRMVWGSIMLARVKLENYNQEHKNRSTQVEIGNYSVSVHNLQSAIMGVATAIALGSLFLGGGFAGHFPFFIWWILGGIICAVLENVYSKKNED